MATHCAELQPKLVFSDDGHGRRVEYLPRHPMAYHLAVLFRRGLLRPKYWSFLFGFDGLGAEVYDLARDMVGHDPGPNQLPFLGYDSNGICHLDRQLHPHLCSSLGHMGSVVRMGMLDLGLCPSSRSDGHLRNLAVSIVSSSVLEINS